MALCLSLQNNKPHRRISSSGQTSPSTVWRVKPLWGVELGDGRQLIPVALLGLVAGGQAWKRIKSGILGTNMRPTTVSTKVKIQKLRRNTVGGFQVSFLRECVAQQQRPQQALRALLTLLLHFLMFSTCLCGKHQEKWRSNWQANTPDKTTQA